ncbi:MAG TPA: prephenate dehydrogenase/arogenate dehydrogenase family protein [Anaerolineales bacterium]|nr:prephenate dehydrogenase/arogenate dehydrogenase family protein [Anaerolineales bacterium]
MEAGFRLQEARVGIIGLGLMGGSLALALRGKCAGLYGVDTDPATLQLALDKKIVDRAERDPVTLLPQADLVILATPVPAIIDFLQRISSFVQKPCIVLDLGSTKKDILQAMAALPERFDPVGGHPICGKEKLGLEHAEASLFQNTPFVVTPLARTTLRARTAAEQIISSIGAHSIEMDAEEHDRALAFTSHLPFLISSAIVRALPQEFEGLIGTGFRSTSRLAGTPSHMMMGVLQSNRTNILNSIRVFRNSLNELESALQGEDYSGLEHSLDQSRTVYYSIPEN